MKTLDLPQFDLSNVLSQLQRDNPEQWTPERLAEAEEGYRRFLAMAKFCPGRQLVPSRTIDEVWHRHILNTAQYADDYWSYLGGFMHHHPSEAPGGDRTAWAATLETYRLIFGEEPGSAWMGENAICDAGGCDTCKQTVTSPVEMTA